VAECSAEFPELQARHCTAIATDQAGRDVAAALAQASDLVGKLARQPEVACTPVIEELTIESGKQRLRTVEGRRELPRSRVRLPYLRPGQAFAHEQHR